MKNSLVSYNRETCMGCTVFRLRHIDSNIKGTFDKLARPMKRHKSTVVSCVNTGMCGATSVCSTRFVLSLPAAAAR